MGFSAELLAKHAEPWRLATHARFLTAMHEGNVATEAFDRWLQQDYFFARGYVATIGSLLSKAPDHHQETLLGGLAALSDELSWFQARRMPGVPLAALAAPHHDAAGRPTQATAAERGVDLRAQPLATCKRYRQFMSGCAALPYAPHALAVWAIERAYNEAWRLHPPPGAPYDVYAERWASPEFTAYVEVLQNQADEALAIGSELDRCAAVPGGGPCVGGAQRRCHAELAGSSGGLWGEGLRTGCETRGPVACCSGGNPRALDAAAKEAAYAEAAASAALCNAVRRQRPASWLCASLSSSSGRWHTIARQG